ncbi:MAG: YfhO family protein, partial [Flammeovirgaceae bacterium]|nr:YfhO family protein [Flammeovirgaceae bacterium]
YRAESGEETLWNDAMFSGTPDFLIATGLPKKAILTLKKVTFGFINNHKAAHLLFLAMFSYWILLLTFDIKPYLAMVGAVAFAFTTYNIATIETGHVTKCWAMFYGSMVLGGLNLVFKKKYLLGFALTTFAFTLEIGATHYQITFYLFFVCAAFTINKLIFAIKENELGEFGKQSGVIIGAILLAASTATANFWMTKEYTPYSIRGNAILSSIGADGKVEEKKDGLNKEYAFSWSQGKMETFTLLVPYLYGGGSNEKLGDDTETYKLLEQASRGGQLDRAQMNQILNGAPLYWGDQPFTAGPVYAGAIFCFLFVFSLFVLDKKTKYWILAGVIISMMFAWGKHLSFFNYFLFDYIPGFNKFRSVSMALTMVIMLMPLAGLLAVQKLWTKADFNKKDQKNLFIATGIVAGICLLMVVLSGLGSYESPSDAQMGALGESLQKDRESIMKADALRSMFLILMAAALLYLSNLGKLSKDIALIVLGVLLIGDVWMVGKRYLSFDKFTKDPIKKYMQKTKADEFILSDKDPHYRVLNIASPPSSFDKEAKTSYYHKSIGGYFAAKMMRYKDLIERQLYGEQQKIMTRIQAKTYPNFAELPNLNMLNAKYIKLGSGERSVIKNEKAMGNAWFVPKLTEVNNPDEEMAAISAFNPAAEAFIYTEDDNKVANTSFQLDSAASVELVSYGPREIKYKANNSNDGFVVFSEIYYPEGWSAKIDDSEVDIKRVNYLLRGLEVPAGSHEITFEFNPTSYVVGSKITMISSWLVGLIVVVALSLSLYQMLSKKEEEQEQN